MPKNNSIQSQKHKKKKKKSYAKNKETRPLKWQIDPHKKIKVKTWRAKSNSDEVQTRFQSSAIHYLLIPASKHSD